MSKKPLLETTIGSLKLPTCIFNASGPRSGTSSALNKVASSQSGAVLAKSATVQSQTGNPHPRTWHHPDKIASLNSEGLPNNGIKYYISTKAINETFELAIDSNNSLAKPYLVSISGKNLQDNLEMLQLILGDADDNDMSLCDSRISGVELNLACPNVIGKPIIAYDFDQLKIVLETVSKLDFKNKILGLKLPPYFDVPHYKQACDIINQYKSIVTYVASINTVGNSLAIDSIAEMPVISSNQGFAGLSGKAVKYIALANVKRMREYLDKSIDVIGVGGVETGEDVFELILCGAKAVQVGTCHWVEGASCFDRLCSELLDIMKKKNYNCLDDFCGKLKEWNKEGASKSRNEKKGKSTKVQKEEESAIGFGDLKSIIIVLLVAIIAFLVMNQR